MFLFFIHCRSVVLCVIIVIMRLQLELEYVINCSTKVLFSRLSTAEGLSEWFADDVKVDHDIFTFIWNGWNAAARIAGIKENKCVRFEWTDHTPESPHFFEFNLEVLELTGDLALIITDCAEHEDHDDAVQLWDAHISNLRRLLGS